MNNDNIQIGSPRAGGVSPRTPIKAQALFDDVKNGVSHERRTDGAAVWDIIDKLKGSFLEKLAAGPFSQDIAAKDLTEKFQAVQLEFAKYKAVGIEIPKEILEKFVSQGGTLLATPAYIDSSEAERLKDLVYEGEQRLKFNEQLKERAGLRIDGVLGDGLSANPSEENLLIYCDALKKAFEKKRCFPDAVTSDPDPQKFVFFGSGSKEAQVIIVKTKADLEKLQFALAACNEYGESVRANSGQPALRRDTLIAAEPAGTREGAEKRQIMMEVSSLGEDNRTTWDKFCGFFGVKTDHVEALKLNNKTRFEQVILPAFDQFVAKNDPKNNDFKKAVLDKQPQEVQEKLKNGERLTADELKKLQADTHLAMLKQRYLDELRENPIPAKFELEEKFVNGKMPEKAVFEKYLHKLREELMRANYPTMITSDLNPHKFKFFIEGKYEEFTVYTLRDLRNLRERLDVCVKDAKKQQIALGRYEPGAKARVRADESEKKLAAATKERDEAIARMKAEDEEARTKVTVLQAAYSEEKNKVATEKEEQEKKLAAATKERDEAIARMKAEDEEARTKVTELQAAYSELKAEKEAAAAAKMKEAPLTAKRVARTEARKKFDMPPERRISDVMKEKPPAAAEGDELK